MTLANGSGGRVSPAAPVTEDGQLLQSPHFLSAEPRLSSGVSLCYVTIRPAIFVLKLLDLTKHQITRRADEDSDHCPALILNKLPGDADAAGLRPSL